MVILLGVIGGTLAYGILGLFVSPVILILGYELIKAWINDDPATASIPSDESPKV
jgi:predicted PurR-regulated permease PerM